MISFIPATPIDINRNDVRLFRITLLAGQALTLNFPIAFGDIDVSVFDGVTTSAQRIVLSAHNGTVAESVSFTNNFGSTHTFQIEVRAVVNSRFKIGTTGPAAAQVRHNAEAELTGLANPFAVGAPKPLIAGPPALQTAIGDLLWPTYLPVINR